MNDSEQLEAFHAALIAFEIRFEQDLICPWERLQKKAHYEITKASTIEKHKTFDLFFKDVENELARVIHEYFPSLLQIAISNRTLLHDQSPIAWTRTQIVTQAYSFMGTDEIFNDASAVRADSRVLASANLLTTSDGWLEDGVASPDFLLPKWTATPHPLRNLFRPSNTPDEADTQMLSKTETLDWAKQTEFWIRKRIESQVQNESLDALIEGGKHGIFLVDVPKAEEASAIDKAVAVDEGLQENEFIRNGATWRILFAGETCSLPIRVGLDYIFILLQHAGQGLKALELQALVTRTSLPAHQPLAGSSWDNLHPARSDDLDSHTTNRNLSHNELVDPSATRQVKERAEQLKIEIVRAHEAGNPQEKEKLQKELEQIKSYLAGSRNVRGRPRSFADETERARQSISHALARAYTLIRQQAPHTAEHLESWITRGSEFMYRDSSTHWKLRR